VTDLEPEALFEPRNKNELFRFTTLERGDRRDIVDLTTSGAEADMLSVGSFELSALGANVELSGKWSSKRSGLASWSELGQGGRALNTVVVYRGYLFPLGHRAIYTTYFRRRIAVDPVNAASDPHNYPVAYLQYQSTIQVIEPVKSYPAFGQPFGPPFAEAGGGTTDWPFASVRMVTLVTPYLDPNLPTLYTGQAVFPTVIGADVMWDFVATDLAGTTVAFSMPLAFVYGEDPNHGYLSEYDTGAGSFASALVTSYNDAARFAAGHARYSYINGTSVRFAHDAGRRGVTTHPALSITLGAATTGQDPNASANPAGASQAALESAGQPNFYPTIQSARIRVHAAEVLTGAAFKDAGTDPTSGAGGVELKYYPPYVASGVSRATAPNGYSPSNSGCVYLQAVTPPDLAMPASAVGALATPDITVAGLSAVKGLAGGSDLDHLASTGQSILTDYFSNAAAQLLGGLQLDQILDQNAFQTPTFTSQLDPASGVLTVTYALETQLVSYPDGVHPVFMPDSSDGMLRLSGVFTAGANGAPPTATVNGSIDPFTVYLVGKGNKTPPQIDFISLHFESLTFAGQTGNSPTVHVNLDNVSFDGPLSFVNGLEQFLQNLGGSGLSITVEAADIKASTSLALPNISLGVFNLSGLSFSGGLVLPLLDGQAVASFAFASADNPFTLTVAMFGGGGYLSLVVGFGGVQSVDAAFEFTGQLALNLYVASGSLSLSAGVHYSYTESGGLDLSGFVHFSGQLSVLGIITISATLQLQLQYASQGNCVTGQASLTVGVSVCGFSQTVSVTVSQTFAGSGSASGSASDVLARVARPALAAQSSSASPPTWGDLVNSSTWGTYCGAFGTGRIPNP
jgi:hypothetical protein